MKSPSEWNRTHFAALALLPSNYDGDKARTYLQPHYGNGVFNNVYLSAGQH